MTKPKNVEEYIVSNVQWKEELTMLRSVINTTEMEETIKWGVPTYTLSNKNIVGIAAFKSYVGLWFHNGALLKDKAKVLINAQEGKTVALRQWRFKSVEEININLIKTYLNEAIFNHKEGKSVVIPKKKEIQSHALMLALEENLELKKCFMELTKGKQREYHEYIAEAKKETTQQNRINKIIPLIEQGKGLYDKYKKSQS
ncbi:YdeI/OmpD-associated family protein [Galbibacter orientalis]|uniref:YdeI/OmpD-associated family protein n=1 Tax=Galbibacter orientalis TaxID=453852 RepID=UPI00307FD0BD